MMRNYYYLVAGLPELIMDQDRKDFSVNALKQEVKEQVSSSDYRLVEFLHLPYDNDNFLNKLLNRGLEFNDLGSYEKFVFDELDENINQLPQYMQDFYYRFTGKQRSADDAVDQGRLPDVRPADHCDHGQELVVLVVEESVVVEVEAERSEGLGADLLVVTEVAEAWRAVGPLADWVVEHVGAD